MFICHCLALPHLPWTCGVPSPAVTWQPGPVPVLSVSYQTRPCRPLPMLCTHCSGVRWWWEQGRKLNSCCLCLHTGFDLKLCGAFDCWKTVKSGSFKPKPMFAGSELYNWFFTLSVQHFMWYFFSFFFFFLIISRHVVYKRNQIKHKQTNMYVVICDCGVKNASMEEQPLKEETRFGTSGPSRGCFSSSNKHFR